MPSPDLIELLARIGSELGFLTPLEPGSWPEAPALVVAVDAHAPATERVLLALDAGVAEAIAANLGAEVTAAETACEIANVIAGHLLPAIHDGEVGFSTPTVLSETPFPPTDGIGVLFAEGRIGLAVVPIPRVG